MLRSIAGVLIIQSYLGTGSNLLKGNGHQWNSRRISRVVEK